MLFILPPDNLLHITFVDQHVVLSIYRLLSLPGPLPASYTDNTKLPHFNNHLIKQCVHRLQITTCQSDSLDIWYAVFFGLTKELIKALETMFQSSLKKWPESVCGVSQSFTFLPRHAPGVQLTHPTTDKVYFMSCTEMQLCFTTTD